MAFTPVGTAHTVHRLFTLREAPSAALARRCGGRAANRRRNNSTLFGHTPPRAFPHATCLQLQFLTFDRRLLFGFWRPRDGTKRQQAARVWKVFAERLKNSDNVATILRGACLQYSWGLSKLYTYVYRTIIRQSYIKVELNYLLSHFKFFWLNYDLIKGRVLYKVKTTK